MVTYVEIMFHINNDHLIKIPVLASERPYSLSHCLRHNIEDLLLLHCGWYSVS